MKGFAEVKHLVGKSNGKNREIRGVTLQSDRKMERVMGTIRAEGDDGGERKWGARHKHKRHRHL